MPFSQAEAEELLVACHRRCCICHRFCGVKIELDHADPAASGGSDDIANAIPVCFECHAEINSYNDKHPRGRKFRPTEKIRHRDQWLKICRENPAALIDAPRNSDVGPLQAMIDELEYNAIVADRLVPTMRHTAFGKAAALFRDDQFVRAISQGAVSILDDNLRASILRTYAAIGEVKQLSIASVHQSTRDAAFGDVTSQINHSLESLETAIRQTLAQLLSFLGTGKKSPAE